MRPYQGLVLARGQAWRLEILKATLDSYASVGIDALSEVAKKYR